MGLFLSNYISYDLLPAKLTHNKCHQTHSTPAVVPATNSTRNRNHRERTASGAGQPSSRGAGYVTVSTVLPSGDRRRAVGPTAGGSAPKLSGRSVKPSAGNPQVRPDRALSVPRKRRGAPVARCQAAAGPTLVRESRSVRRAPTVGGATSLAAGAGVY